MVRLLLLLSTDATIIIATCYFYFLHGIARRDCSACDGAGDVRGRHTFDVSCAVKIAQALDKVALSDVPLPNRYKN